MKSFKWILSGGFVLTASFYLLHAQQQTNVSDADTLTMLQAVEMTSPVPAGSIPECGTFWSAQHAPGTENAWAPLPANMWGLEAWPLGDGQFLLDDTNVDYDALAALVTAAQPTPATTPAMSLMMSSLSTACAYSNLVYLTNMFGSFAYDGSITANFSVAGGTNFVPYDIEMSTSLSAPDWRWQGIAYTSNSYALYGQPTDLAFYRLAKPSKTMTVGIGGDAVGQCDVPYGLTNALQVAGGAGHSIALLNEGTAVAWGWNSYGQATVPTNLTGVAMVAAGWYHSVAMLTNGSVVAWGYDVPSIGYTMTNVPSDLTNAVVISAQALHTLALRDDGTVVAWGYNDSGETNVPAGLSNVVAIAAGYQFNLAVTTNGSGTVVAWGFDGDGQCDVPAGLSNVVDVAAGTYHSLALLNNGTVVAWGDDDYGESDVPAGLSNVVAIAAGGDPYADAAYSMALKSDGTIVTWGTDKATVPVNGLNNVIAIGAGNDHALVVRTGPATPVIILAPTDQYQVTNGNVTFTARGAGLYGVAYQWQTNGMDMAGETNATLNLTNVQVGMEGPYDVVITDNGGMGSLTSSNVFLHLITAPVINSQSLPTNDVVLYQASLTLSVSANAPGQTNGFPLSYQWQFNGTNISGATSASYTFSALNSGTYSVIVSNAAGSVTVSWTVTVLGQGSIAAWGDNQYGESTVPAGITNISALAAGEYHSLVVLDNGTIAQWGDYEPDDFHPPIIAMPVGDPPTNSGIVAVAASVAHDLALTADGRVIQWGLTNASGLQNFPTNLTGVKAISAGVERSLALLTNGTIVDWGSFTPIFNLNQRVPADLTNVTAISCGAYHWLALRSDGTVESWGYNTVFGETNVPAGLSNVAAIAGGGRHSLALKSDGTVVAWGDDTYGQCDVPVGLSNVMAIAAGNFHSVALKNDGTIISWGDNSAGQTNGFAGLNSMKLIAAGGNHTLANIFSSVVSYPLDVTKDLLLIYNTNSQDSATVLNYYLAHRPMVSDANVLGIGCITNETISSADFTSQILLPYLSWLNQNPTKRPQYLVLFMDIPSLIENATPYASVQCQLSTESPGIQTFVTSINMNGTNGTNDCIAYINKLVTIGGLVSSNSPVLSASAIGYANTNYVIDDVNNGYCGNTIVPPTTNGLLAADVTTAAINFLTGCETSTSFLPHITNAANVAGYICWGSHSNWGTNINDFNYAVDGSVQWSGNSGWWIVRTEESYNGVRVGGQFLQWFSSNAFGGTNYLNTPIGGPTYVFEPDAGNTDNTILFDLWASGKNLAICCWVARNAGLPPALQVVGDPFVTR